MRVMVSAKRQRERKLNKNPGNVGNQDENSLILHGKTELMSIPSSCCFSFSSSLLLFSIFRNVCDTYWNQSDAVIYLVTAIFLSDLLSYFVIYNFRFRQKLKLQMSHGVLGVVWEKIKTFFFWIPLSNLSWILFTSDCFVIWLKPVRE